MEPVRILSTEAISTAAFLEAEYATNATVSRQVTGVTAATEVQHIAHTTLTQSVYVLTVGATTLTTASLDSSPTTAELVTAIQAATGYGAAPFGVTAGTGAQLVVTWESSGAITDTALLTKNGVSAGTAVTTVAGATGVAKKQVIDSIIVGQYAYKLVVDSVTLTTSTMPAGSGVSDIVLALQADGDYAAAPFTIAHQPFGRILVSWKNTGEEADVAVLTLDGYEAGTTTTNTNGVTGVTEIQEFTPVLDASAVYRLTVGATVLTTSALDSSPTIGELVTALQADGDYAGAAFTLAADGAAIELTWKSAATVADLGTFDYRKYVDAPYSAEIPDHVNMIRYTSDVDTNVAIGANADATSSSMLVPAGVVEYFRVAPGERVSAIGSAGTFYVSHASK